jgi:hypothetical protein
MIPKCSVLLAGLLLALVCPRSFAQKAAQLGDAAPPLTVGEWVKGKPVRLQPGTNFYAVVFCTLSRANELALTNLSGLQKKYQDRGLIVVVISDDPPTVLRDAVQARGAEMNFTIADDDIRKTTSTYQFTFHQWMSPRAYVVDAAGKVLWYGHPMSDDLEGVVADVAAGRYNLDRTRKSVMNAEQMEGYLQLARHDDPKVSQAGRILLTVRTNDSAALCDLAFRIATDPLIEKRDFVTANLALDRAEQVATTNGTDIAVTRAIVLFRSGHPEAGLACAKQALATVRSAVEKGEVTTCIRDMEALIAAGKTNSVSASDPAAGTNSAPAKP